MRFNIQDGKSSVVWPTSLLPGLESKCCKWKGGLLSVVTNLNAKNGFIPPHPFHIFFYSPLFCPLNFSKPFFFILQSHYFLSFPHFLHFPLPHLISALFCALSLPPSHTAVSGPLMRDSISAISLKVKIPFISLTFHFFLLTSTGISSVDSALKTDFYWTIV